MKKVILSALIICAGFNLKAQKEPIQQTNHHEIGIDASPFLSQIFPGNGYYYYTPYMLTYRYHFKKSAIRAGVSLYIHNNESTYNDTSSYSEQASDVSFRLGYERKADFGRHWQFFYGLDARVQFNKNNYEDNYTQTQSRVQKSTTNYYGIAPLMGFRFKINERISVTTETSFLISYFERKNTYEFIPVTPPYYTNQKREFSGFETSFNNPVNIIFTYNF